MENARHYLYTIRPARVGMVTEGPTPREAGIVARHAEYLWDLAARGIVLVYGRTENADETTFGIVIFQAPTESAARRVMDDDPAVRGGVMRAALYPYRVVHPGARARLTPRSARTRGSR